MRLGRWIKALSELPPGAPVHFDDGTSPGDLASWRGRYEQLTLTTGDALVDVSTLLVDARSAIGREFEGYKGGTFTMDEDSPVWADDYGQANGRGIIGITGGDRSVVILTADLSAYVWG